MYKLPVKVMLPINTPRHLIKSRMADELLKFIHAMNPDNWNVVDKED